jgi:hypothetical protein
MQIMNRLIVAAFFIFAMASCGGNDANKDAVANAKGAFFDKFKTLAFPYILNDSVFQTKTKDSFLLAADAVAKFLPDSIYKKEFGKKVMPKLFAIGKMQKDELNLMIVRAVKDEKQVIYGLGFDKDQKFVNLLPLLNNQKLAGTFNSFELEKNGSITLSKTRKEADGATVDVSRVYAYSDGNFVMAVSNGDWDGTEARLFVNPIDTLPRTNKNAGDFTSSEKGRLISFRDGKMPNQLLLFIHFDQESSDNDANGELKGEVTFVNADSAFYKVDGDPCTLGFTFRSNAVTIHEQSGCGNHRCLSCEFKGTYTRGKYVPTAKEVAAKKAKEEADKLKKEKEKKDKAEKEKKAKAEKKDSM